MLVLEDVDAVNVLIELKAVACVLIRAVPVILFIVAEEVFNSA